MRAPYLMDKKRLLLGLVLSVTCSGLQAQVPDDFYRYYHTIRVQDGSSRVFDQKSDNSLWANVAHGQNNQQWVVMPTYVKSDNGVLSFSDEYIIGSRRDGDVMDINSGNGAQLNGFFHGGPNQLFNLVPRGASNTVFYISSPKNTARTLDKKGNGGIVFNTFHGLGNQQFGFNRYTPFMFQFLPIRSIVRIQPPTPPTPTSFDSQMITETPKFFRSETLIPYPMVKNDSLATFHQVESSPFYRLVRSQYYRLPEDADSDVTFIPGEFHQKTLTTKTGMRSTSVTEVSRKLNVSFTAGGEVAGPLAKVLTFKATASLSRALELSIKNTNTFEETSESTVSLVYEFRTPQKVRLVTYQLVDHYELYRQDGSLVLNWDVGTPLAHRVQYFETSGGRIGHGTSFSITNGAVVPIG